MADDDWDAEDFEPPPPVKEKEPVKSQWDDEEEEEEQPKVEESKPKTEPKKKPAKKAQAREVVDETLADPVAEKLRQQRLVEESDFKATKELFGGKKQEARNIDEFIPKTEAEFVEYAELVAAKITPFSKSFHYVAALKALMKKVSVPLTAKDAKELSAVMSVVANEKLKLEKEAAGGKKKGGKKQPALNVDKPEDDDFRGGGYSGGPDDEYDFM